MAEIKEIEKFHIFSSVYFSSAVNRKQYVNDGRKEIAFIGRSNVGKSSLINNLCGQRKLAYVSREPGKTRTINYYAIQSRRTVDEQEQRQEWYLVDLPGYGFAKTSQENKDTWSTFIDDYIKSSPSLVMVGLLHQRNRAVLSRHRHQGRQAQEKRSQRKPQKAEQTLPG